MGEAGKALERAEAALETSDWAAALPHLLAAWRENRAVRLAEVIDRVSERIAAERGPIAGKSIAARSAAWLEVAKERDAADLARLLVTPWPGKWQDWVPLVGELLEYPDDPRLTLPFARFVEATPFVSWKSLSLYHSFLKLASGGRDVRALPILQAVLGKEKSREWNMRVRQAVVAAVAELQKIEPVTLAADDDALLAKIESRFATETETKKSAARSEAELLAAIRAAPDDDGARAVYADFLIEQANPLGEFVSLQLNPSPSPAATKRIGALLRKHGKAWVGSLDRILSKEDRLFTRGFLSGGHIRTLSYKAPERAEQLSGPEWLLFDTLLFGFHGDHVTAEIFSLPWARNLRVIRNLSTEATLAELGRGLLPRVEELHVRLRAPAEAAAELPRRLAAKGALPSLKRLGLSGDPSFEASDRSIPGFLAAFPRAIERLWVTDSSLPLAAVVTAVTKTKADVRIVEVTDEYYAGENPWWRIEAHRDDAGRYSKLRVCSTMPERPIGFGEDRLVAVLAAYAEHEPTTIEFAAPWVLADGALTTVRAAVEAIPSVKRVEGL